MSFSGKKFKRVSAENLEKLAEFKNHSERIQQLLSSDATFSFTKIDDTTYNFILQTGDKAMEHTFKLGEESEITRRDGSKVLVTYEMEGDNVLRQIIKQADGQCVHFRREFSENKCVLAIKLDAIDVEAKVFYELVD